MNPLRREVEAALGAVRFFTRVPVPNWVGHAADGLTASARYFPAVGLLVGAWGALVFLGAAALWPLPLAIILSMAATVLLTGAFHEDGLADTADGLGGGWDKEGILRIMKDSRTGSYGVVALILMLLGKYVALTQLPLLWIPAALVAGHGLSRLCATALIATLDYARDDASSKAKPLTARLSWAALFVASGFALAGLGGCMAVIGAMPVIVGVLLAAGVTFWLARMFTRRLGGYTGDLLGATQQTSELAFYFGLACLLT